MTRKEFSSHSRGDGANKGKPAGTSREQVVVEMNPVRSSRRAQKSNHKVRIAVLSFLNLMHHKLATSIVAMRFVYNLAFQGMTNALTTGQPAAPKGDPA